MRFVVGLLCAVGMLFGEGFQVGTAQVEITPPEGAPMAGYYFNRGAAGVHDPLLAKAMVLERAGVRLVFVSCDLLSMPGQVATEARGMIASELGIPATHVMISATHTHTGPVLVMGQLRYNVEGEMRRIGEEYTRGLPGRISEAATQAARQLQPAKLYVAKSREDTLTFNRRFWMKDGTIGWNPGKRNPNIVRPAGPIDGEVPILYAETLAGRPIAGYVNYALHLDTVGGQHYSADYPYSLARTLQLARGEDFMSLFTLGAAGNLNHIDVSTSRPQKGNEEAARIGSVLGAAVLKALTEMEAVADAPLRATSRTVALPLATFRPAELERARMDAATFGKENAAPFLDLVRANRILSVEERQGAPIDAEVQVFSIGNEVAWVALPGEIFTELGMAIKIASPFKWTAVVTLANDNPGYIPDRKAHAQGAYEAISARVAAGSGELLVESATHALVEHAHGQ